MSAFFAERALLPDGWANDVRLEVNADGVLIHIQAGSHADGAERLAGPLLPGMPNLHSHAFQRAMAGLAEVAGNRIVNVDPFPGSLSTVTSPPIMRQKRRLMARPSPVPPYLRVVEASACAKGLKSFPTCSAGTSPRSTAWLRPDHRGFTLMMCTGSVSGRALSSQVPPAGVSSAGTTEAGRACGVVTGRAGRGARLDRRCAATTTRFAGSNGCDPRHVATAPSVTITAGSAARYASASRNSATSGTKSSGRSQNGMWPAPATTARRAPEIAATT